MRVWNPDVLIEVKELDPCPLNARQRGQRLEEIELRGASGGNDASCSGLSDNATEAGRRVFCGRPAHRAAVRFKAQLHYPRSASLQYCTHFAISLIRSDPSGAGY